MVLAWSQKDHSIKSTIRPFDEYLIKTKLGPEEETKLLIESISQKTVKTPRLGNGRIAFTPQSRLSPIPFPVKPRAIRKAENHGNARRLMHQALKTAGP
jgi:SET domain-containing protein